MQKKFTRGRNKFYTAEIDVLSQGRACNGYGKDALTTELFCCVICSADIRSAMECSSMIAVFTTRKALAQAWDRQMLFQIKAGVVRLVCQHVRMF